MARSWFSVCFLALLSSGVVPEGEETPSWISGNLQGMMFSVMNGGNVRFHSDNPSNFTGLTVCLRVLTEQTFSIHVSGALAVEEQVLNMGVQHWDGPAVVRWEDERPQRHRQRTGVF
ncbi:uncharacterized protein LOC103040686 isoform X3 [Astyanax mexicanus]|uniref:uncharacterized protein LOC103040686 isoform X3 n=1 Tax=Astyanax mexicanus TaxID=7994 RepID=UPI0020CADC20|nr:uncharacterized protein LOC103040686 isoform X3 [Astyanax mexicanus]